MVTIEFTWETDFGFGLPWSGDWKLRRQGRSWGGIGNWGGGVVAGAWACAIKLASALLAFVVKFDVTDDCHFIIGPTIVGYPNGVLWAGPVGLKSECGPWQAVPTNIHNLVLELGCGEWTLVLEFARSFSRGWMWNRFGCFSQPECRIRPTATSFLIVGSQCWLSCSRVVRKDPVLPYL